MGFIGTGLSKLGAASAQQLGIAAAASLSVMAVSFSAIAYQGYVTEKKQELYVVWHWLHLPPMPSWIPS